MTLDPAVAFTVPPNRSYASVGERLFFSPPPPVSDERGVSVRAEIRRLADGAAIGVLRSAVVESCSAVLNGVGESSFSWRPDPTVDPGADALIADGRLLTWREADVELWVWRQGRLVFCGPIVAHDHDPMRGRVTSRAWSREGYLQRLVLGRASRPNLFAPGYVDGAALDGWFVSGVDAAGVQAPLCRRDWSMRVSGVGEVSATLTVPAQPIQSSVEVLVVARYLGDGWDTGDGAPVVATVQHRTVNAQGAESVGAPLELTLPSDHAAGRWHRMTVHLPMTRLHTNHYDIDIAGPGSNRTGWIGEVEVVQPHGAFAGAGADYAAFVDSFYSDCLDYLGSAWTSDVASVGVVLADRAEAFEADHPDMRSLLSDAEIYGDWWIPVAREPTLMYRRRRGRHVRELVLTVDSTAGLTAAWDATAAATEVIALADGTDGHTREEAGALLDEPLPGARLMHVETTRPRGLSVREMETAAAKILADEGPTRVAISGKPGRGPTVTGPEPTRDLPGAWVHLLDPGDTARVRIRDGALDYSLEPRASKVEWAPGADTVDVTWLEVPA